MKNRFVSLKLVILPLLLAIGCKPKQESDSALDTAPLPPLSLESAEIELSKTEGYLPRWVPLYITFPDEMVDASLVSEEFSEDTIPVISPVVIEPNPGFNFTWLSPRRGVIRTFGVHPDMPYRVTLREGLKDRKGRPVNPEGWGAEYASEDFGVAEVTFFGSDKRDMGWSLHQSLPITPHARITFSHNVLPSEVAERVAFVNAETGERHPVFACLEEWQTGKPQALVFVRPVSPLKTDQRYWLVVDRVKTAEGRLQTDYLRVYPAGYCAPIQSVYAKGYNQPRLGSFVRVFFNRSLDRDTIGKELFSITPSVENLVVKTEKDVAVLAGDFQKEVDYTVSVTPGVKARGGVATTEAKEWSVTIPERRASIILPGDFLEQPFVDGVDVSLSYCRTEELKWHLAEVPAEKFHEVKQRLKEFAEPMKNEDGTFMVDPRDSNVRFSPTERLGPALGLREVASATLPAAPDEAETERRIQWKPEDPSQIAGVFLLEVEGRGVDGRICGNRMLVSLTDWFMNFISGNDSAAVRLSRLGDGTAAAGVSVRAYDEGGQLIDEAVTDSDGLAKFQTLAGNERKPKMLMAGNEAGRCAQEGGYLDNRYSWARNDSGGGGYKAVLTTNGDLFKPGEEIQLYVTVREIGDGTFSVPPAGTPFHVTVGGGSEEDPSDPNEIPIELSEAGAATLSWKIPDSLISGKVTFNLYQEDRYVEELKVDVTEFRPPTFSVDITSESVTGTEAKVLVQSHFFHGSANKDATVTWTAEWVMNDWLPDVLPTVGLGLKYEEIVEPGSFRNHTPATSDWEDFLTGDDYFSWHEYRFNDRYSESASRQGTEGVLGAMKVLSGKRLARHVAVPASFPDRGEAQLGEDGELKITTECPFPNLGRSHRAQIFWTVDVKTPAGLSRRASANQKVQFPEKALALEPKLRALGDRGLPIRLTTITVDDKEGKPGTEVDVEVFRRTINTVQERLSDKVLRYRNSPRFDGIWKRRLKTPFEGVLPARDPGDYVVVATPVNVPHAAPVSVPFLGVRGKSDMVILNDVTFDAELENDEVPVGEEAVIKVRTPFPGSIRATIETNELLESLPLETVSGTADEIRIRVRREYFPNAFIRLHLMGKSVDGDQPAERIAIVPLRVHDPERQLSVNPVLDTTPARVRSDATGHVLVEAGGKPVRNAEVLVFAVDEAVLSLSNWEMPDVIEAFYPERKHDVKTFAALGEHWSEAGMSELSQFEKGYILGSGDEKTLMPTVIVRENEDPRPMWLAGLKTDGQGRAEFSFTAPDTLTSYRIAALAHTAANQFGIGENSLPVTNPLRVEPALPRFVREGDEIELRCQLTQEAVDRMTVDFSIEVDGDPVSLTPSMRSLSLEKDKPEVVTAKLTVDGQSAPGDLRLVFKAIATDGSGLSDATAVTLDLLPRFTERTELITGELGPGTAWNVASSAPNRWKEEPGGTVDVMVSGTEWLPYLATFSPDPSRNSALADLSASAFIPFLVPGLVDYLPWSPNSDDPSPVSNAIPVALRGKLMSNATETVTTLEQSLIPDGPAGWLPQYPGHAEPNDAVTALVSWAVQFAKSRSPPSTDSTDSIWSRRLTTKLAYWREDTIRLGARSYDKPEATPFVRAAALYSESLSEFKYGLRDNQVATRALFENREKDLGLEGRCFLALAMYHLENKEKESRDESDEASAPLSREEWAILIEEIRGQPLPEENDYETLSTPQRAAAIRLFTLATIAGRAPGVAESLRSDQLSRDLLVDGRPLTAQEKVWRLLAADAFLSLENPAKLAYRKIGPGGHIASPNGVTLGWLRHPVQGLDVRFPQGLQSDLPAHWVMRATYRAAVPESTGSEKISISREVFSHGKARVVGSSDEPLEIGDYVLLNYRIKLDEAQDFVVIEEQLPAALEPMNPDLASVREAFSLPEKSTDAEAGHAEHGPHYIKVTFNSLPAGESTYTVLTQVVAGGSFSWPATQATLIYDQRLLATTSDVRILATR